MSRHREATRRSDRPRYVCGGLAFHLREDCADAEQVPLGSRDFHTG